MHLAIFLTLCGAFILPSSAAPVDNAAAGPSTIGGTPSGSAAPPPPGDSASKTQPATVEFGKVYGAAKKDYTIGPPTYSLIPIPSVEGNSQRRKTHKKAINVIHPFIPVHQDGDFYKGHVVTHTPPIPPGGQFPEHHVASAHYGAFPDQVKRVGGKTVIKDSRLLTTPRYVAKQNVVERPKVAPESLHDGKFEELKKTWCKRGLGGCSRKARKAANRKSSTVSKVKAHNKATKKSHRQASQKPKSKKGFAGKSKPMRKVKPAGGRGTSRTIRKKGHK